jgi:hypothetical protein
VSITVLSVMPARSPQSQSTSTGCRSRFIHGIRALRVEPAGTRIELPKFRDAAGMLRSAITLPDEIRGPIGDALLDALIDRGIAKRQFVAPMPAK